ncbi:MAG: hypothetical protein JWP81_2256 [Ferruginibacter sp.]|nr:hypothetical protein [Ferruginibacter sp.]
MLLFEVGFPELTGIAIVMLFGLVFYLLTELRLLRREMKVQQPVPAAANGLLPLQAYERLTLLTDRITLKNLVSRMHSVGLTADELQAGMVEAIRNEYEHNTTQQMYVNPEVWKAVTNMKEQNIFIINQLSATLSPGANATDLSKLILEYASNNNSELGPVVLDAIQFEVKKLI